MNERRVNDAPPVSVDDIPKDQAVQRLISHMAHENYNLRLQFHLEGDAFSDWLAAEKRYIRIFMRRRSNDSLK
jgi:hypothetical protein